MSNRLAEIEQGLVDDETAWSEFEFGQSHFEAHLDNTKWLIAEVKRYRQLEDIVREHIDRRELPYRLHAWMVDNDDR